MDNQAASNVNSEEMANNHKRVNANSVDHDPSEEVAALRNSQKVLERQIEALTKSLYAMQVGYENYKGPHLKNRIAIIINR